MLLAPLGCIQHWPNLSLAHFDYAPLKALIGASFAAMTCTKTGLRERSRSVSINLEKRKSAWG
jgi:hypothetical protein